MTDHALSVVHTSRSGVFNRLIGLAAAIGLVGTFATQANAQLVVDQQQTVNQSGGGAIAPSWTSFGQSFRPALSSIDWAEFVLQNESSPFTPISLSLSILNGVVGDNGLEGPVIATSPAVSLTSTTHAPLQFQFASTVALTPGNTYVLRVNILTPNEGLGWRQAFGNPYPNGQMLQSPYESEFLDSEDAMFREGVGRSVNWNVAPPSNGNWHAAANWMPVGVPTAAHTVNIANGGTCTNGGGTGSAAVVNLRGGSTLDMLGTLACGGQVRVGDLGGSGLLAVRNSGIVNASSILLNADGGSPGTLRIGGGFGPGTVNAPVSSAGPAQVEFNHDSGSYTFAQPLSGSLSVVHQAGTTTLSSAGSNYTGSTTVSGGTLRITNNFNFNSPTSIAASGALVLDIAQDVRLLQSLSGSGPVTVAGNGTTARLAGNDSAYAGMFSLPNGTRGMMWSNAASGSAAAAWDLSGQFAMIETPSAATVQLGALSGVNAATQLAAFTGTGLKTFVVGARGTNTTFAGQIKDISTFGGGGTNTVALQKVGAGTLTLSNNNTYTAGTTVNGGTLRVNGSIAGPATVASGGTLGGAGIVNGSVQIQPGGTLSPGASPGQLTSAGPITLNGTLHVEISGAAPGTGYDQLIVSSGSVTLGASSSLTFGLLSGTFAEADKLFIVNSTGAGTLSGTFASLPDSGANGTPVPALNGLGGLSEWRIYYGADQATNSLTGGNDVALAPANAAPCTGDVNGDQQVDLSDLTVLLGNFGNTSGATLADGDLDGDGDVDLNDLTVMLSRFGAICP